MDAMPGVDGTKGKETNTDTDNTNSRIKEGIAPLDTTIVSATPVVAPVAYCNINGYVTTTDPGPNQVNFQLGLPTLWNGRFLFVGNGGYAGSFASAQIPVVAGVIAGVATAITDTGHQGVGIFDGSWALNELAKQVDFQVRAVHVSTVASKAILHVFYDQAGVALFFGCSTGGRQGLVEAQQYPEDFDGIIAGAPALGNWPAGFNWNMQQLTAAPENYIPPDKIALLDDAVMQHCDAIDGVVDGLIQDPRKCTFNPAKLRCKHGNTVDCLTAAQIQPLRAIYAGPSIEDEDGEHIYAGFTKSDPAGPNGWARWLTGFETPNGLGTSQPWMSPLVPPLQFPNQDHFLKFFVFSDPTYNSLTFDLANEEERAQLAMVLNRGGAAATDPDLSAFINRGGKLLLYHGWSDPALSPLETIRYYKNVVRTMGGGVERIQDSVRLFMAPGMQHCGSGPGPNNFNPLPALLSWVLTGTAPDQLIAVHFQDNNPTTGVVTRSMPLCPYPEVAVFTGGDVNVAANWVCQRKKGKHRRGQ
ncbi:MAG: tannase/feruloyl esterase family alpha/beta hydrolase [Candidatus Binatia bacterium]